MSDIERLANRIWILKDGLLHWHGDFDDLKDSVVRVHLRAMQPLQSQVQIPNALAVDFTQHHSTAIVHGWSPELEAQIAALTGAKPEVEWLTLEDIFLAMHR